MLNNWAGGVSFINLSPLSRYCDWNNTRPHPINVCSHHLLLCLTLLQSPKQVVIDILPIHTLFDSMLPLVFKAIVCPWISILNWTANHGVPWLRTHLSILILRVHWKKLRIPFPGVLPFTVGLVQAASCREIIHNKVGAGLWCKCQECESNKGDSPGMFTYQSQQPLHPSASASALSLSPSPWSSTSSIPSASSVDLHKHQDLNVFISSVKRINEQGNHARGISLSLSMPGYCLDYRHRILIHFLFGSQTSTKYTLLLSLIEIW